MGKVIEKKKSSIKRDKVIKHENFGEIAVYYFDGEYLGSF